jgi:hypothetical protein
MGVSAPDEPPLVLQLGTRHYVVVKRLKFRHERVNILFDKDFSTVLTKLWF